LNKRAQLRTQIPTERAKQPPAKIAQSLAKTAGRPKDVSRNGGAGLIFDALDDAVDAAPSPHAYLP
jgi:hypothetical protein